MRTHIRTLVLLALLVVDSAYAANCYTLYDSRNRVVRQGFETPVDLSRPISDELAAKFPGHHLVIGDDLNCSPVGSTALVDERGKINRSHVSARANSLRSKFQAAKPPMELKLLSEVPNFDDQISTGYLGRSYGSSASVRREPGNDVRVRAYTRSDGTFVQSYTRSARGTVSTGRRR